MLLPRLQEVTLQMVRNQITFVDKITPATFIPILPQPTAIAMGRDALCSGAPYLLSFVIALVMCLIYIPLVIRLLATRGDVTLLRHSRQMRSGVGWWREDDQRLALGSAFGLDHVLAVKNPYVAILYILVLRVLLVAVAEALLRPAAEFFFHLVFFGAAQVRFACPCWV
jgi:hypothetical protein